MDIRLPVAALPLDLKLSRIMSALDPKDQMTLTLWLPAGEEKSESANAGPNLDFLGYN